MNSNFENPRPLAVERSKQITIYACSGCSDAGELADRAARALSQAKCGEMSCLAGIGGRVRSLLIKAEKADHIVAIDGCPLNCARHTLAQAGFQEVHHLELHRLGFRKGSCPPTEERLAQVVEAGVRLISSLQPGPVCAAQPDCKPEPGSGSSVLAHPLPQNCA